jgi:nucleotide-binding universal stress UspA family protein
MSSTSVGIVVGVDGSAASRIALNWAARRARDRGLPITIVLAVSSKTTPVTNRLMVFGVRELPHRRVSRIIDDAVGIAEEATSCRGETLKVSTQVVAADPLDTLVELSSNAALVVVGARRRSPWWAVRSSLGSALVSRSHCPVAIVRDGNPSIPHPAHAPAQATTTGWSRST